MSNVLRERRDPGVLSLAIFHPAAALLLLFALACSESGRPDPPRVLDLLAELSVRSESDQGERRSGITREWVLNRTAEVEIEGTGRLEERCLLLESSPESPAAVRLTGRFSAQDANGMLLHLKLRGKEAEPFGRLAWRREGEAFSAERSLRIDLDVQDVDHFTALAIPIAHPEWTGEIVELRLEPLVGEGVVRLSHVILGRAEVATQRSLGSAKRGRLTLGEESRRARRCPVPGRLETEVEILEPADLRVALGASLPERSPGLRLAVEVGGETILQVELRGTEGSRWRLEELPLDRWVGERVSLAFVAEPLAERAAGSAWLAAPKIVPRRRPDRPNVVLVSLDTLRADHLSLYGYQRPTSPELEELGARSWVFERAYSQAPVTLSSHISLLTGRYRGKGLEWGHRRLPPHTPTIAELHRRAGYLTAAFTDGGFVAEEFGIAEGFDLFNDDPGGAEVVFRRGLEWLDGRSSAPFFLFLHTYEIHSPYDPPEPFRSRFERAPDSTPERLTAEDLHEMALADPPPPPEQWQAVVDLYDAGIAYTDSCLGGLLDGIAQRGLGEDTVIVIVSDHGEELGDRGAAGHGQSLFEEMIRVPLIIHVPERWRERLGLGSPQRFGRVVELVDVLPTLAKLTGVAAPRSDGDSLIDLMKGRAPADSLPAFSGFQPSGHQGRALITERWKLYRFEAREGARSKIRVSPNGEFVYDLAHDPAERESLDTEHTELRERLQAELRRAQSRWLRTPLGEPTGSETVLSSEKIDELKKLGYLKK